MRIFAFMGIIFNGYLDIWTSWIFGHHGYLDIMDIRTSWIFGHHGYSDIIDIRTSRIFGHHGYLDIMHTWTSWIFGHPGYSDTMDIRTSWIFRCHGYLDVWISWISQVTLHFLGKLSSRKKIHLKHCQCKVVLPSFTFETLALQVPGGHFLIFRSQMKSVLNHDSLFPNQQSERTAVVAKDTSDQFGSPSGNERRVGLSGNLNMQKEVGSLPLKIYFNFRQ